MNAILYIPGHPPQQVSLEGLDLPDPETGFAYVTPQVASILDCAPDLVDTLATGKFYVAYSIFDFEGEVNRTAMAAVADVTGVAFDIEDEDAILHGPVLLVSS